MPKVCVGVTSLKVYIESFTISTSGEGDIIDLTDKVWNTVKNSKMRNGLVHVFAPHATGVLVLTENERGLLNDIRETLDRLIPKEKAYMHPSNAHSHIRSVFLAPSKTIPLIDGKLALGIWQSIMFMEVDIRPRRRTIIVQVIGE